MERGRAWARESLARYWPAGREIVARLPVALAARPEREPLPPVLREVVLPEWAESGVAGKILVPAWTVTAGTGPEWTRVDWWAAAFWYLHGAAERAWEEMHGPIHSYSPRLAGWDERLWQRAWANRIGLFLREWALRAEPGAELGPLPAAEVLLTHDVDAVRKTLMIRAKQTVFHLFNGVRAIVRGRLRLAFAKFARAARFLFSRADYWCFPTILALEEAAGVRSHFNFHGGFRAGRRRNLTETVFDPAYDLAEPRLAGQLRELRRGGWTIGLHPSFAAWAEPQRLRREKERLEECSGGAVTAVRQHWLRFGWGETWRAQQAAGLELDTTLGFNDRPAFRNGAALRFHPWEEATGTPLALAALPMVLMDSQLYDYRELSEAERRSEIDRWLGEVRAVRGQASIIWHQRVFSPDYGWGDGYRYLLEKLK